MSLLDNVCGKKGSCHKGKITIEFIWEQSTEENAQIKKTESNRETEEIT
jgi:hypothetical protein